MDDRAESPVSEALVVNIPTKVPVIALKSNCLGLKISPSLGAKK